MGQPHGHVFIQSLAIQKRLRRDSCLQARSGRAAGEEGSKTACQREGTVTQHNAVPGQRSQRGSEGTGNDRALLAGGSPGAGLRGNAQECDE